jgi:lysophospholipase L1-like esterase
MRRFSWRTRVLPNLLLVVAGVTIGLALSEVLLRIVYAPPPATIDAFRLRSSSYYQPDEELGWVPRPNVNGLHTQRRSFDSRFTTNSLGFRGPEVRDRSDSIYRIVVLGDSFTWGFGVDDDETYAHYLGTLISGVEVVNLGVTGYGLRQIIGYYRRVGFDLRPDVVVLGLCLNDIFHGFPSGGAASADTATSRSSFSALKSFLNANVYTYRFLVDRLNQNKGLSRFLVRLRLKGELGAFEDLDPNLMPALLEYPPALQAGWDTTRTELLELRRLVEESRATFIIAVVPARQTVDPASLAATLVGSKYDGSDFDLDKPYTLLVEFARANGIEVVNPVAAFREAVSRGRVPYLRNDMHFNSTGNELYAAAIADRLRYRR